MHRPLTQNLTRQNQIESLLKRQLFAKVDACLTQLDGMNLGDYRPGPLAGTQIFLQSSDGSTSTKAHAPDSVRMRL